MLRGRTTGFIGPDRRCSKNNHREEGQHKNQRSGFHGMVLACGYKSFHPCFLPGNSKPPHDDTSQYTPRVPEKLKTENIRWCVKSVSVLRIMNMTNYSCWHYDKVHPQGIETKGSFKSRTALLLHGMNADLVGIQQFICRAITFTLVRDASGGFVLFPIGSGRS